MNSKTSAQGYSGNFVKWLIASILIILGVIANTYYQEIAWPLRLAGWIVLAIVVGFILGQTSQGKRFYTFSKDARMELRKVDWPKRQETVQFTVGVVVMVIIMALALWVIDAALLWIVKWFTG